jgi:hypothetical protein
VDDLRVRVHSCGISFVRTGPLWDQLEFVRMCLLDDRHTNLASATVQRGAAGLIKSHLFGTTKDVCAPCPQTRRTCVWLCPCHVCVSMPYPWLPLATHGCPLLTMGPHGSPWVPMGTHGYPCVPMATHGNPWLPMGAHPLGTHVVLSFVFQKLRICHVLILWFKTVCLR